MVFDPSYGLAANAMNEARTQAVDLYRHQAWQGRMRRLRAFITRTSTHLQQLYSKTQGDGGAEGAYVGMRTIAIEHICGSEERAEDFDPCFRPLAEHNRERWLSVAEARLQGLSLPPVQLIEVSGQYYVRDGHHRISVAQALGESFVDAEVVRWQMR